MTIPNPVAQQADAILAQCACFIEALPDAAYVTPSNGIKGGTIGKHVRHCLDHYRALIEGHADGRVVEYDHRERNVPIEVDRAQALEAVQSLRLRIGALASDRLNDAVRIRVMLAGDGSEAELGSTLARELAFASHHAIHHHAMMKAIAQEHGQPASSEFGVAPSTLNFETHERRV